MSETELGDAGAASTGATAGFGTDDLAAVRDLILRAHPDIVPELLTGSSISDLTASIEPARAAYQRIVEQAGRQAPSPPAVPAGGAQSIIDPDRLPTAEKLRRGLASRGQHR